MNSASSHRLLKTPPPDPLVWLFFPGVVSAFVVGSWIISSASAAKLAPIPAATALLWCAEPGGLAAVSALYARRTLRELHFLRAACSRQYACPGRRIAVEGALVLEGDGQKADERKLRDAAGRVIAVVRVPKHPPWEGSCLVWGTLIEGGGDRTASSPYRASDAPLVIDAKGEGDLLLAIPSDLEWVELLAARWRRRAVLAGIGGLAAAMIAVVL